MRPWRGARSPTFPMAPRDLRTRRSFSGLSISSGERKRTAAAKVVHEGTFNCVEAVIDHALVWPCQPLPEHNTGLTIRRLKKGSAQRAGSHRGETRVENGLI